MATVLNAAMWATLGGIGITVAQDLYPTGIGLASSLYFSAIRFAAAIGGIAGEWESAGSVSQACSWFRLCCASWPPSDF